VSRTRFHLNVVGDFYVEDGCCLACGVPEDLAPDLFASDGAHHCYVQRQPRTPEEVGRMVEVFVCQDLECIRYAGTDSVVRRSLRKRGAAVACDYPGVADEWAILLDQFRRQIRRLLGRLGS